MPASNVFLVHQQKEKFSVIQCYRYSFYLPILACHKPSYKFSWAMEIPVRSSVGLVPLVESSPVKYLFTFFWLLSKNS